MSCGRTSATRPMIAGMATSIYAICRAWPAPPNVARVKEKPAARGRIRAAGPRSQWLWKDEAGSRRSTGRLGTARPFTWVARKLVGEVVEEADHPGAPLSKGGAGRDDIPGTAETRPLKYREHQIVAVARLGASDEWLLSEQSLKRQARGVELDLPSRPISGCVLEALPQRLLARASEIVVILRCETPDKVRVDQAAQRKVEHVIRPQTYEARGAPGNRVSKQGRLVGKTVFEIARDLPGVVNDLRAIGDDGHEVLPAKPLDGVNVGEAYGAILDVYALVGERVADAPRKGARAPAFETDTLVHDDRHGIQSTIVTRRHDVSGAFGLCKRAVRLGQRRSRAPGGAIGVA